MGRPKGHITHPVYRKCTGERDICIIKKFSSGSVMVGEAHGRRGEHRAGLIHNHGRGLHKLPGISIKIVDFYLGNNT